MSVSITFYTVGERKPKNGEDIIYLLKRSSYGSEGFEPKECQVELTYIDEEGTGCCERCNEDDVEQIIFGHNIVDDDWLWVPVEEYWNAFDNQS